MDHLEAIVEIKKDNSRIINYNFFHWGPLLYKTSLTSEEVDNIKKVCSEKLNDAPENRSGLIKIERKINIQKLFPIIYPYLDSYAGAYINYLGKTIGKKIKLKHAWVNHMVKYDSSPLHIHEVDFSFVIYTEIPKKLKKEFDDTKGSGGHKPGAINFINELSHDKHILKEHSFSPNVGDFFIFPASLHHYVNSFKCEGERISISGNLEITNE
tara:strand:+ start:661 stop:1296 length:636 start_codon:yes stop_codon:yes gene_type:complete